MVRGGGIMAEFGGREEFIETVRAARKYLCRCRYLPWLGNKNR